jgi:hypothetical protein
MSKSKKQSLTGSIAQNLHQGSRSEYLAQYFFSSFGTSIPTPHQEDSGIDLQCTLGEISGKRLLVDSYFFVQVKSLKDNICYSSVESCNWLLSLNYPLIICVINKKKNLIELFHTIQLSRLFPNNNISKIELSFSNQKDGEFLIEDNISEKTILLDNPILKCNINDLSDYKNIEKHKLLLKYWVSLDQKNILRRKIGLNAVIFPMNIQTNIIPSSDFQFKGNFKQHLISDQQDTYYENLFFLLSNEISITASENNKEKFEAISDLAIFVLKNISVHDSYGIRLLQISINKGSEKVHSSRNLHLNIDGKEISTANVKIVG